MQCPIAVLGGESAPTKNPGDFLLQNFCGVPAGIPLQTYLQPRFSLLNLWQGPG